MIQEYLNNQFINITDDANFEKLKKACSALAKSISKDKSKILTLSLVAFDPEIPPDNKEVKEVQDLIVKKWQTFLSNSSDTPLTIVRAVMLEALEIVSEERGAASIIWFATRNISKHYKLGREGEILTAFLKGIGNRIEGEVSESWNFAPDQIIAPPELSSVFFDDNLLVEGITAISMKKAVEKALRKQKLDLRDSQKEFARQVVLMQMRTQLLWWKEASYSPLKKMSYGRMKCGTLQVLLAYDYSNFIPREYPASVDFFLVEMLKAFSSDTEKKIKISDFLKNVDFAITDLKDVIPDYKGNEGRISFISFIQGFIHGIYDVKQFESLVGVAITTERSLSSLVLWMFHDLHSIKLLNIKK